ncbi:inositol-3-phosphate synthase [Streptomyces sp. enrichment culture]|uniref:inositol-3-phosphate synthase n=1 Tax=Streptomyces sp. enrichment culture TaxID=1795815 RepID=UPI003F5441F4
MRTGIWLVGARGSVATTTVVGAAALRAGLMPATGCVSALEPFRDLPLPGFEELVFGGHDVVTTPLAKRAGQLAETGVLPSGLPDLVAAELAAADAEIRPAPHTQGPAGRTAADAVAADLTGFRERHGLDRVVVVNVSSTQPPARPHPAHAGLGLLYAALDDGERVLPDSALYAFAALESGCAFVDFTPSTGARLPALDELARRRGLPYTGSDGKTGETLVKSVLAPMFAQRALRVRSWSGTNLLGGGDGATLADPASAASKTDSKALVLEGVLGHPVDGGVHIHNVPELGEWKTAWDHITFEGFLGVRMSLQFTWQGCDSALAAPLVLDLARFTALAHRAGVAGPVPQLGFFFKDPVGTGEHGLQAQYTLLVDWARGLGDAVSGARER